MKGEYFATLSVLKILFMLFIRVSVKAQNGNHPCVPDFKPHQIKSAFGSDVDVCVKIFPDKASWDYASAICNIHFGHLLEKIYFNSSLTSELKTEGIEMFWLGIRRKSNYFVINFSELFEEKDENFWAARWSAGEPRRDDCVALNLTSGLLLTRPCREPLPFVCESKGMSDVYKASLPQVACPENWSLSFALSITGRKCVSTLNDARSQNDAEDFCGEKEGRLASMDEFEILHFSNYLSATTEDKTKERAYRIYYRRIQDKETYESCPYYVIPDVDGRTSRPKNCSVPLKFICVKDFEVENVDVWIGKSGINTNETFPKISSCPIEDLLTCNINITDESLRQRLSFRWYKDDIPLSSCASYTCRIEFARASLKLDRYTLARETRQGSYHCEVSFAGLVKKHLSPKMEIFFSDVATYVVDVSGIDVNDIVDYSHHNFENSMKDFSRVINRLLGKLNFSFLPPLWDLQSISVTGRAATVKINVYIHRTNMRHFNDEDVYDKIKRLFEENASLFPYKGNIHLSVNSADVCFGGDAKSSNTCSENLVWPTTLQTENVISNAICLDDHIKPLKRKCKGNSLKKAEWSAFNCSSCKQFQHRFLVS